jgi:hypothetical protein
MADNRGEWIWVEADGHYERPLLAVIDVRVKWSQRKKGWMVKVYNRLTRKLEPYQAGPFPSVEEALGIGDLYIKTRLQVMDQLLRPENDEPH